MGKIGERLMPIAFIAYFAMGLFQLFAVADGISYALGISSFLGYVIAIFLTWVPLIGFAAGAYGAHAVWGWSWLWAILLFAWPMVLGAIAMMGAGAVDFLNRRSN